MKCLKFLVMLTIGITCYLSFSSCSNEDDEPNRVVEGIVNPATVFENGIPQKVGGINITINSDGLVTKLTDGTVKVAFDYPCMSRTNESDVIINVDDANDGNRVIYVTLNELGYSKYWKRVWDEGDVDEYWFEYNADGQLNGIKISTNWGENGAVELSYENGNIVGLKMTPADGGTMKISYGNTPIKNTGGVMIFDMFGVEDSEIQYSYYAGLLGKATVSLPVKNEINFDGDLTVEDYTWMVNDKGLPTKLTTKYTDVDGDDSFTEDIIFVW